MHLCGTQNRESCKSFPYIEKLNNIQAEGFAQAVQNTIKIFLKFLLLIYIKNDLKRRVFFKTPFIGTTLT